MDFNPIRSSTFSASERIMCSFLIESLNAAPLNSIIFISRATMMLSEEKSKENKIDLKTVNAVFSMSERLIYASKQTLESGFSKYKIDLSSLDYAVHIEPWAKMLCYDYYVPKNNVGPDKIDAEVEELAPFDQIVYSTKNLTEAGYYHMCSDFLMYAIPIAQQWAYILTTMISPDTYTDMLKVYKGARDD